MFRPRHGISTLMFLLVILHDSTIVKTTGKKRTRQHDTSNYVVDLQPMRLNYIDESCNDGSKAGFYFRPSANSKAGLWVVFLEGGGNLVPPDSPVLVDSCPRRIGNQQSRKAKAIHSEIEIESTCYCAVNPGFCEANHVYVRYCSSDGWSGDRMEKSDIGFSFRGARIVDELITTLTTNASFGPMDPLEAKVGSISQNHELLSHPLRLRRCMPPHFFPLEKLRLVQRFIGRIMLGFTDSHGEVEMLFRTHHAAICSDPKLVTSLPV
eukprot:jgi/Bigna1/87057/estExt_fgenesh1_pg.C_160131